MSEGGDERTIWVFPGNGCWYKVQLPYEDVFAQALSTGEPKAWRVLLGALEKIVAAAN